MGACGTLGAVRGCEWGLACALLAGCAVGDSDSSGLSGLTFMPPGDADSGRDAGETDAAGSTASTGSSTTVAGSSTDTTGADTGGADGSSSSDGPMESCGDAVVQPPETCDDENEVPCDGCEGCQLRTAVRFDGAMGNAIEVIDTGSAPLQLVGTSMTVEAWMRVEAGEQLDVAKRSAGNVGWRMSMSDSAVVGTVFGQFDHIVNELDLAGQWHHVAWVYDQVESALYLDGDLLGAVPHAEAVNAADAPVRIGAWADGTGEVIDWRAGWIDEVRVSSVGRYAAAFTPQRRFEPDAATVWLAHLDEGRGDTITDASANEHAATIVNGQFVPDNGYGQADFCR